MEGWNIDIIIFELSVLDNGCCLYCYAKRVYLSLIHIVFRLYFIPMWDWVSFFLETVKMNHRYRFCCWNRWSSECLFQVFLFLKSLKRNAALVYFLFMKVSFSGLTLKKISLHDDYSAD